MCTHAETHGHMFNTHTHTQNRAAPARMFSTALATMKFLVDLTPMTGRSVARGTVGLRSTATGRVKGAAVEGGGGGNEGGQLADAQVAGEDKVTWREYARVTSHYP